MVGLDVLPDEPEETLSCDVLASLQLIADEVLEGIGLERSGELAVSDFLGVGRRQSRHLTIIEPRNDVSIP